MDTTPGTSSNSSALVPTGHISGSIYLEALIKHLCSSLVNGERNAAERYQEICDVLCQIGVLKESYAMVEFESVRNQFMRVLSCLFDSKISHMKTLSFSNKKYSFYRREYEELQCIGSGGCGQVFLVKNRLDGMEYAMKKISIRSTQKNSLDYYLSEVKTFASMRHPNIVSYKIAWLELDLSPKERVPPNRRFNSISSANTLSCSSTNDGYKSSRNIGSYVTDGTRHSQSSVHPRSHKKWAILYVPMGLCKFTLKQWLYDRHIVQNPNSALVPRNSLLTKTDSIRNILIGILRGLEYIHSIGITHHDIKPDNIFIQPQENEEVLVMLGDFGLSCSRKSNNHRDCGTKTYAAPEQLNGKCDPKSDIYSLGIVLFELIGNFPTGMERAEKIKQLKERNMPEIEMVNAHPDFAAMIHRMIAKNPSDRPDASVLLQELVLAETSEQNSILRMELQAKNNEILSLNAQLKSASKEKVRMWRLVNRLKVTLAKQENEISHLKKDFALLD